MELLYAICLNCEQFYIIIIILTHGIHLTKSYDMTYWKDEKDNMQCVRVLNSDLLL